MKESRKAGLVDTHGKRLIYITACGRSGTTLLGIVLGNVSSCIDLGEVNEFVRFEGRPNGFGPGTENYDFWARVLDRVRTRYGSLNFELLRRLHRATDYHTSFILQQLMLGKYRKQVVSEQRVFLSALYQGIFDESKSFDIVVDSSKYPSRLWHLSRILSPESLYVIHLKRCASDVIRAMRRGEQSGSKSLPEAAAYYYGIELLISRIRREIEPAKWFEMSYEDFVTSPETILAKLGERFQIDTSQVIEKIKAGAPLQRGYIFNGNRMRMQEHVVFRKKTETV